jgi:hypothetical protein
MLSVCTGMPIGIGGSGCLLPGNLFLIAFPSRGLARRALSQEFMDVGRTTVQLLEWWPDCATFTLGTLRQWIGISGLPVHCWDSTYR